MASSTQPPSEQETDGIAKYEAMLEVLGCKRSGESGLIKALAISWAMQDPECKKSQE